VRLWITPLVPTGTTGELIMCVVVLEEGWPVGCVRPVRGGLRDRSVPLKMRQLSGIPDVNQPPTVIGTLCG